MMAERLTGVVKWFNVSKGYGFIMRDDTEEDLFVHQTAVTRNNPMKAERSLGEGEVVEFDLVATRRGLEANDVTGLGGTPVEGSPYAANKPVSDYGEWSEPEVMAERLTGVVKWFNVRKGYGFIMRDDTEEDLFVHQTAVTMNNPMKAVRSLGEGEVVEFGVVAGRRGLEACDVTGLGGTPVEGSQYAANKPCGTDASDRQRIRCTSAALAIPEYQTPSSPNWSSVSDSLSYTSSSYSSCSPCPGIVAHNLDSFTCRDPACDARDSFSPCSTPTSQLCESGDDDNSLLFGV